MEAITTINLIGCYLLILVDVGIVYRIIHCFIIMSASRDHEPMKKRIKNMLLFLVIANSLAGFVAMIQFYWGG